MQGRTLKKYARPAIAGVAVVVLALLLWWAYRPAKHPPRPLPEGELGLLVLVNGDEPGGIRTQRLLRYPVQDGEVGPAEVVWAGDVLFFHHWRTRIVDDRYVVTGQGGVLDLSSGKVILDERHEVLRAIEGGKVVYRAYDGHHFAFDLARCRRTPLDATERWTLPGLLSPDGTKSVEELGPRIILHRVGEKPTPLGDDFHVGYTANTSTSSNPPKLWLDDDRLLTQIGNGRLVVVNVNDGSRSDPLDVPATTGSAALRLWRDGEGGVIYEGGRGAILVDADARRWSRYGWQRLGHGFELSLERADERPIRYDGRTIGRLAAAYHSEAVIEGHVALIALTPRGTRRGVWVWSAVNERATMLDVSCDRVIGWVK